MRTVAWDREANCVVMIDQRILPGEFRLVSLLDHHQVAAAIQNMTVRGAPAIGVSAAYGMALAAQNSPAQNHTQIMIDMQLAAQELLAARPTAVNLKWALDRVLAGLAAQPGGVMQVRTAALSIAEQMADEDVQINLAMARHGAELIADGDTLVHHCNTGALAAVDWGTALGVIRMAWEQGKRIHVLVDETRPRLQGARLTAWELGQYGIPYDIITDGASGYFMRSGQVHKVFFGADRIAANGDVANKIGTYMLALAAFDNGIPAYSVAPTSTVDLNTPSGEQIPIEMRPQAEVLNLQADGQPVYPQSASARNPAFDVTPARLVCGIVTEAGVVYPPYLPGLAEAVRTGQT